MPVDDPGQEVSEIGERIDVVELAGLDQGPDDSPVFGTAVGSGKLLVLRPATDQKVWEKDTPIDHDHAYTITGAPRAFNVSVALRPF